MLPLICDYAVANAKDISCVQHFIENSFWVTELIFFKGVASVRVEMNSFYSELRVAINSKLTLEMQERVNFFAENEELLLERVKRLHLFAANLQSSFRDFEKVTVAQFGERK